MIDVERTIISQYGTSSTIGKLIACMNEWIDPRTDIDNFYNYVWNVDTAQGFGLDIWGRIVDISREVQIPTVNEYFGFQTAAVDWQPFNQAPFFTRGNSDTETYILADDAYRKLILTKALSNISATTNPAINRLLTNLFADRGRAYVLEGDLTTLNFCFEFLLSPVEHAIMTQSNALPRPAGRRVELISPYTP